MSYWGFSLVISHVVWDMGTVKDDTGGIRSSVPSMICVGFTFGRVSTCQVPEVLPSQPLQRFLRSFPVSPVLLVELCCHIMTTRHLWTKWRNDKDKAVKTRNQWLSVIKNDKDGHSVMISTSFRRIMRWHSWCVYSCCTVHEATQQHVLCDSHE